MKRLRVLLAVFLVVGVVFAPATATAQECSTINGHGYLDFGTTGEGVLRLSIDGERQLVPLFPTGFREIGEGVFDIRFVMLFEEGTLVVIEHSFNTPIGEGLAFFESELDVKKGGSGSLYWYGIADQNTGFAHIQNVTGEICFGR